MAALHGLEGGAIVNKAGTEILRKGVHRVVAAVASKTGAAGVGVVLGLIGYRSIVAAERSLPRPPGTEGYWSNSSRGWGMFISHARQHGLKSAIGVAIHGASTSTSGTEVAGSGSGGAGRASDSVDIPEPVLPAYRTREDAMAAAKKQNRPKGKEPHIAQVTLRKGDEVEDTWWEVSEVDLGKGRDQPFGDTEQKAVSRLDPNKDYEGYTLEITGTLTPCDAGRGLGCSPVLASTAVEFNLEISYMYQVPGAKNPTERTYFPDGLQMRMPSDGKYYNGPQWIP